MIFDIERREKVNDQWWGWHSWKYIDIGLLATGLMKAMLKQASGRFEYRAVEIKTLDGIDALHKVLNP